MGLIGYYRKFIPNFASMTAPLNSLTHNKEEFKWTAQHETILSQLKQKFTTKPILAHPDFNHPFVIQTDACDIGLGAVLCQRINEIERVIQFTSRTLNDSEKKWSIREKEALSIIWACEQFRPYIIGNHFEIETDHESLQWLSKAKSPARLVRWALRLEEFNFTINYKRGKQNGAADGLSRLPIVNKEVVNTDKLENYLLITQKQKGSVMDDIDLANEQKKDKTLLNVIEVINKGDKNNIYNEYTLIDNVLKTKACKKFDYDRPLIPLHLRETILKWHHNCDLAAHSGRDRTLESISKRFFWPGMYKDIQTWVAACLKCIKHKSFKPKNHGLLVPIHSRHPFEIVAIDIIGPFKETTQGYKYVLVMVDLFTSWVEAAPLKTLEAQETVNAIFKEIIVRHGCPSQILTDRGTQFSANLFEEFCRKLKIKHPKISSLHPQTNGKCERFNRFLKNALATVINYQDQVVFLL